MSDEISPSEAEINGFLKGLSDYIKASPNENQYIFEHILKQLKQGAKYSGEGYLKGNHGYEPVTVLEANQQTIVKRIFHPKDYKGADFAVSKIRNDGSFGVTVVQVKRNHGNSNFTLTESNNTKELTQLQNFSQWRSGYYLMIDETTNPPVSCFVTTGELISIISSIASQSPPFTNLKKVDIPNSQIHKYCRGSRVFYKAFYDCYRGATIDADAFAKIAFDYVNENNRALVELLLKKRNYKPNKPFNFR